MTHRDALEKILRICYESSEYTRRTQHIHEIAMVALGMTKNQRDDRHIRASVRSEEYKKQRKAVGMSQAKKALIQEIELESGESRTKCPHILKRIIKNGNIMLQIDNLILKGY